MEIIDVDLSRSALLLDIDGTLLDIAPSPGEVRVPSVLLVTLERLAEATGGALALVSGRLIADIDGLFAPLKLTAVGAHGAEMRLAGKRVQRHGKVLFDPKLRQQFADVVARVKGTMLEDKQFSVALHYRNAIDKAEAVQEAVAAVCSGHPEPLEMLPGKAVIEVKAPDFNKGTAVRELMTYPPFTGRRPIFIGDDVTDQAVFDILPEFDGMGFSVGQRLPGLVGCFPEPSDVRDWLYRLQAHSRIPEAGSSERGLPQN